MPFQSNCMIRIVVYESTGYYVSCRIFKMLWYFLNMSLYRNKRYFYSFIRFQQSFVTNILIIEEYWPLHFLAICQMFKLLWQSYYKSKIFCKWMANPRDLNLGRKVQYIYACMGCSPYWIVQGQFEFSLYTLENVRRLTEIFKTLHHLQFLSDIPTIFHGTMTVVWE